MHMQSTCDGLKEYCAVVGSCQSIAAEASQITQILECINVAARTVENMNTWLHAQSAHFDNTQGICVLGRQLPEQCWQCSKSLLMRLRLCQVRTGRLPWPCQAKKHLQGVPCKLRVVCVLTVTPSWSTLLWSVSPYLLIDECSNRTVEHNYWLLQTNSLW